LLKRNTMRELELAGIPSFDDRARPRRSGFAEFPLSRAAFVASIAAHVLAGYALSRHLWPGASLPPPPTAEYFLFEMPAPLPPEAVPVAPPVEPVPQAREEPASEREPAPAPAPRAVQPVPQPTVVVEPPPTVAPEPSAETAPAPSAFIDFDEERRRAANEVVTAHSDDKEYLTFSMDDLVEPRPKPEPHKPSIFDGTGASKGPNVGQLGQARTKFGQHMSALCNALTGGFSLMGWGSSCASPSDGGLSGLFPEIRPAYLDLMPECVDTFDTAPELAREAPFPTIKCRLVMPEEIGRVP
jgi:hypothetical protein